MHIKFTRMKYVTGEYVYKESKNSVWIPAEDLKRAIVRQEENYYQLLFLGKSKLMFEKDERNKTVENVKENPIELLEKYEKEKEGTKKVNKRER